MKGPLRTRYVPLYDLFKLIVGVILTIILILLLLRESQDMTRETNPVALPTYTNSPTVKTAPLITGTPSPEITEITAASIPTSISTPTATAKQVTEPPPTESPTPATSAATPMPEPSPTLDPNTCPANPTHIKVGDKVKVLDWLNFREGPGLNYRIQHTNRPGTQMDVIGGPVCAIKGDNPPRAYLWWNVRMGNGKEGWSAESPLNFPNYFLEPVR